MHTTTGFCFALLAGCAAALQSTPALANDTQVWLNGGVAFSLDDDVKAAVDVSQRWIDDGNQFLLRGNVDVNVTKRVSLGGGAAYVDLANGHEFRPHQQLTLKFGHVGLRTRLEERFFSDADRAQLRLRQRVALALPVTGRLDAALTAEGFYVLQSQTPGGRDGFVQYRLGGALARRITPDFDIGAGYLLIGNVRPNAPDAYDHVLQIVIGARL
ncbi:DUF2490 domain-containing protein [Altererythrobacter salegens]|uniref:DUF2490 domain-containing protein n=1 Tax=Croceibacterium salegens TaxID=1737568 RepID=A0A6I4SUW8_9SPHN|nr:DUF2490 domain-containing protein [Croceibacterium salegens]MXO58596.1 DUF2490 domain-containing protein [Croceibacterium salegens]